MGAGGLSTQFSLFCLFRVSLGKSGESDHFRSSLDRYFKVLILPEPELGNYEKKSGKSGRNYNNFSLQIIP